MKKIAIITPGVLPVPATHGGAIENLIEYIVLENEKKYHIDLTIFSVNAGEKIDVSMYKYTKFVFINEKKLFFKIGRIIRGVLSKIVKSTKKQYIFEVTKIMKKEKMNFDFVIVENKPQYVLDLDKLYPNKIILHMHNDFINSKFYQIKEILRNCRKILTVSDFIKKQIIKVEDVSDKISVVYNGIAIERFLPKENIVKENEIFTYTYVGRIVEEKGLIEILIAFRNLLKKYDNIKLVLVGSPKFRDAKDNKLIKEIRDLSLQYRDKIIVTGFVNYEKIPDYYACSDVMLAPSKCNEALGISVIEAVSTGSLLITTNDGGIPEIVDSTCAYICNKDNLSVELENNMEKAYLDKNMNDYLKENTIKRREFFTKERFVRDFFDSIN